MIKRNATRLLVAVATVLAALGVTSPAHADPAGAGYIYYCSRISSTNDFYQIAFSKIYTCSSGPMDGPSWIDQVSTYTGKQTGKIGGECAWYGYHKNGWTSMTRVWNWCLTNPVLRY
jgi:hypothetical protein